MNWIIALVIFVVTYLILFTEKMDRTIATLGGAVSLVLLGTFFNFYSEGAAFEAINFDTIILVLGMMIMVGALERTGLIQFLAIRIAQSSQGQTWKLLVVLGAFTAVASAFLDNVTTMVLVAPITLSITDLLGVTPVPFLISESMLSIVGGMSTLIGAPPNIMIGSASSLGFNAFLTHLAPIALIVWCASILFFKYSFHQMLSEADSNKTGIKDLEPGKAVDNWNDVWKASGVFMLVVLLYLSHRWIGLDPPMVAFIGATLSLLLIQPDVKEVLSNVEWNVLLFYTALFVLVGGLESVGVIDVLAKQFGSFASLHPLIAPIVLVWIAGVLSGIIDNVPLTIAIIPIIQGLAAHGVHVTSFWWALALGAVLGGMSTPIGSSANVVSVSLSEGTGNPITFSKWLKVGVPLTAVNLLVASSLLYLGMIIGFM